MKPVLNQIELGLKFLVVSLIFYSLNLSAASKRNINLEWEAIEGATKYQIKLTVRKKDGETGKSKTISLKESKWNSKIPVGQYKMQIRSFDYRNVPGDWSESIDFNVKSPVVKIIFPKNKEKIKSEETENHEVRFQWEPVEGATAYEVKVVSKDKAVKKKEIIEGNSYTLSLPVANLYGWKVTAIFENNEKGEESKRASKFLVYGAKINKASIKEPESSFVRELQWEQPEFAQKYSYAIQRKTKEGKWKTVLKKKQVKEQKIPFSKDYEGGQYKLMVKSYSKLRQSSEMSEMEFEVTAGDRSPAAAKTAELKESLKKPSSLYGIASWFLSELDYYGKSEDNNSEARLVAVGGTGRVGIGYDPESSDYGFFAIYDFSGITLGQSNYTYGSGEVHATWTKYFNSANQFRASAGLFSKQLPYIYDPNNTGSFTVENATQTGLHAGFQLWVPMSNKYGFQIHARTYLGLPGEAPNKLEYEGSNFMQTGFLGSYRLSKTMVGFAGYSYKRDIMEFKSYQSGMNTIEIEGQFLNLKLELSF